MRDHGPLSTLSREGFMHRARLLAPVLLLLQFVAGCGDGGSQTPTSPPAPPTNRAPTVSGAIPDQVLVENTEATVDISGAFSDPDGDALRYVATSDASSVATASVSGSDLKVIGEAPGSATITVTATDPGGLSATQTLEVTVNSANRAPTVSGAIPDQVLVENTEATVDISGAFSDPDGDALRYVATSDASSVATASVSGSDLKVIGEAPGSATITVTATDPGGLSATQTLEVTVNSANRAPTVSGAIPDQVLVENTEATVDISGAFSDPDGDALRYVATSDASSVATASVSGSDLKVIGEAPGSATITVTATDPGGLSASATITVTATDPGGLSANQTFEVTVAAGRGGADLDALLAPPTADEITQVKEEWDTRTPEVSGVRPELDSEVPAGLGSVRVRILSHTVGGLRHYGAVVTPVGAEPGSLPVILYAHGGDGGVDIEDTFLLNQILQRRGLSAALVIPSYRSEPLRLGGQVFLSEGPPSPWDRDVDDTISLLSVALEQAPELDEERVAIVGFSRGGGVGLLTAARDPRIDAVVEFFGLTDLFDEYAREIFEEALDGELRDLPGLDYLNEILVLPWKLGVLSDAEARLELVRRSGVYFVDRLPPVQLHHGTEDTVVAVSQAYRLIEAMDAAGKTDQDFEKHIYDGAGHDITALIREGADTHAIEFLRPFLSSSRRPHG